jgi:small subunit ribosomal protein S19
MADAAPAAPSAAPKPAAPKQKKDKYAEGGGAKAARRRTRKQKSQVSARRRKEFTFRGLTLPELQALSMDEVLPLLPARARRTLRRGLSEENQTFVTRLLKGDKPQLKTHRRDVVILPAFVGKQIQIYNGKEYRTVEIKPEMIGHYIGEFALTRQFGKHSGPGVGATRSSKFMPLK